MKLPEGMSTMQSSDSRERRERESAVDARSKCEMWPVVSTAETHCHDKRKKGKLVRACLIDNRDRS